MSKLIKTLNWVSNQLLKIDEEPQIYQVMYNGIREILPEVYFLITKRQPNNMNFRVMHSFGFDEFIMTIQTLLGKNPFEMDFSFNDLNDEKLKAFESGKLYRFKKGVYDLVNGKINQTICKTIEKILRISNIYAISFSVEKKYFGGATIFVPQKSIKSKELSQETVLAIETIANQASIAINNLRHIQHLKDKENDLIISKNRFNQHISLVNDIVWKANGDGTEIIDMNNSFEKYYGFSSSDFSNDPNLWIKIVHPKDKEIAQQSSKKLFDEGKSECEYRIIKPDGTVIWLNDRKSIVFDSSGAPIQMGGIATDITERKLQEEQLKLKNYALENSSNAIGIADLNGTLFYVNKSFLKLWSYDKESEVIGRHISNFTSNKTQLEKTLSIVKQGKPYAGEDTLVRKDGTTFNCIVSANLVTLEQKPNSIMAVFTDITERSIGEMQLREHKTELEKQNKEKDKFLSIISHDLRAPFNGILGFLELLSNDYYDYTDKERLEIIQSSHHTAQSTFNLISDLLDWARLQNEHFIVKKEVLNLNKIINENIELYKKNALEKEIIITNMINSCANVKIDKNSINTVIRNLLNNAIKFTKNGGSIKFIAKQNNQRIELSIVDNGIGMNQETIKKLFRIDKNISMLGTNNEKGTGLGLTICNELIIKNNWKINIDSQLGKGTTIKILIPTE